MKVTLAVALTLIAVGLGLATGPAFAQYPPQEPDEVAVIAENVAPSAGSTIEIAAAVVDAAGEPVVGVDCTFAITEQPGDDAEVDPGPSMTDAEGIASTDLSVGSTPGEIVVEADCGEVSAVASVVVQSDEEEPAAPPASLPNTGSGVGTGSDGSTFLLLAALAGAAGVVALPAVLLRRRLTR